MKHRNQLKEQTTVLTYYSFDTPQLHAFSTREEAVNYIETQYAEEIRIQTEENGKDIEFDLKTKGSLEQEYRRIEFLNGDIIEWCIPDWN